jgi:hypothetical protein
MRKGLLPALAVVLGVELGLGSPAFCQDRPFPAEYPGQPVQFGLIKTHRRARLAPPPTSRLEALPEEDEPADQDVQPGDDTQSGDAEEAEAPLPTAPELSAAATAYPDAAGSDIPRLWGDVDYLLWWIKHGPIPLDHLNYGTFSGFRVTLGGWLNPEDTLGLEGSGFLVEQRTENIAAIVGFPPSPTLGLPGFVGTGFASSSSQLWGFEANSILCLIRSDRFQLDALVGFRNLDLQENLLSQAANTVPGGPPPTIFASANFQTQNAFYGGQVGARTGVRFGRLTADAIAKVALGDMHEGVGLTALAVSPAATVGFVGRDTSDKFAVLPEARLELGYDISRNIHAFVGYQYFYVSNVVRPGEQPSFLPFSFATTDFYTHGLNFGFGLRF